MAKLKNRFLILIIVFSSPLCLFAQNAIKILDTLELSGKKIIIYSDNTWSHLNSETQLLTRKDSLGVFSSNWETKMIYGYLSERGKAVDYHFDKKKLEKELLTTPIHGNIYGGFHRGHDGVDISLNKGDELLAAMAGKVRYAQFHEHGYGNLIIIRHYNGLETWYSHLDKIYVKPNQLVNSGDVIGTGGRTGRASANHLHFEVRYRDKSLDPEQFFNFSKFNILVNEDIKRPVDSLSLASKKKIDNQKNSTTVKKEEPKKSTSKKKTHTVKSGDTLSKLAVDYHTTVDEICKANKIKKTGMLSLGQKIIIPN